MFLSRGQDDIVRRIEDRISKASFIPVGEHTMAAKKQKHFCIQHENNLILSWTKSHLGIHFPSENGEGIQILHYDIGQKYGAHNDYFFDKLNTKNGGQRIATMLMYL